MKSNIESKNFGIVIAFLIPGFVLLFGARYHINIIENWLSMDKGSIPEIGGFLYTSLASIAAGVGISAFRWLVIDHWVYKDKTELDFTKIKDKENALNMIIEKHYMYYLFYGNMFFALAIGYVSRFASRLMSNQDIFNSREAFFLGSLIIAEYILIKGACNARERYYERALAILS